jgi:hypothetical protein
MLKWFFLSHSTLQQSHFPAPPQVGYFKIH